MTRGAPERTPAGSLALLLALYLVQGLPFGFQSLALPVLLRERGVSLSAIGLAGALALPWALKFLWAPFVDAWSFRRLGRRRSWILPLLALFAAVALLPAVVGPGSLVAVGLTIFLMNLVAATLDIAVDGLAVDLLARRHLGLGNTIQVVGYKVGMLVAGGVLVATLGGLGWGAVFAGMAGIALLVLVAALFWREPASADAPAATDHAHATPAPDARPARAARLRGTLALLARVVSLPGQVWLLVFIATYKIGEVLTDPMFKTFLKDVGYDRDAIARMVGFYGMFASIAGSLAGGLLAHTMPFVRAITIIGVVRTLPMLAQWWLVADPVRATEAHVVLVTIGEQLASGALTVPVFALMMSRVDRRIGASHYTLLAAVEVWGKSPAGLLSGVVADAVGYTATFALGAILSILALLTLRPLATAARLTARG